VLGRGAQTDTRGAAQVLDRGVQAVARGALSFLLQELGRDAQAVVRDASTLSQQDNNSSVYVQQSRVNITVFICTMVRKLSRRCTCDKFESLVAVPL
jgi:hypothetical protein